MSRPNSVWFLIFLLVFLGLGGLYGGIAMLSDPTGKLLQMNEILPLLPVSSYTLPGLFLVFVMGIFPIFLAWALLARPHWSWAEKIVGIDTFHWAWTGTLALGLLLMTWLSVQALLIGFKWPIQYITAGNGILILWSAALPGVRKYYHHEDM